MNIFSKYFFEGGFGLERETLRIDKNGRLAQTPHPFDNPHLQRDFCENQLEIITGVNDSVKNAVKELAEWDLTARKKLAESSEHLHIYSNPPYFSDASEIPVAHSGMEMSKFNYRKQLEQKYGKPMMLYSGIHFNFSLSEKYLRETKGIGQEFGQFKDSVYFRLMKQIFRHSWLIVLLTAASPIYDRSFVETGSSGKVFSGYGSMRNSEFGYWNQFIPTLDYSDIESFTDSIQGYIDDGFLLSPAELYLPVRLKPKGTYSLDALKNGIDHIELRMFDLNPLSDVGIFSEDAEFAHLLMLYLLHLPDFDFRTCVHRILHASFRQILPIAVLKKLTIRQYAFAFSPCSRQNYARKSTHKSYEHKFLLQSYRKNLFMIIRQPQNICRISIILIRQRR